jgi:Peptidase_C39 like family
MRPNSIASLAVPSAVLAVLLLSGCNPEPVVVDPTPTASSSSSALPTASSSGEGGISTSSSSVAAASSSAAPVAQPASKLLDVVFSVQAPFANWDALHQEACEEISLIMVHHFLTGTPLSKEDAEKEIQEMVAWQTENGYGEDVTAAEIGAIAKSLYGHNFRLLTNVTAQSLRQEIAKGNPVIIPAAGQMLGNPYFSGDGPPYHMLVVTGYTGDTFIVNDPGTKRGEDYKYSADVLIDAIHDWTGSKDTITSGAKTAVVIEP